MKRLFIIFIIMSSCNFKSNKIDSTHIESLAEDFMKSSVIPKMNDPKPFAIISSKAVIKTVADNINDYRFVYDHLSLNQSDSEINKRRLDSIVKVSIHPDSIISVTVDVAYKTRYKMGDIVTDSIKLAYSSQDDKITFWPF